MMSATQLREALAARPFQPFTVHVADQRTFLVRHPEFATVGPKGQTLVIWGEDDQGNDLARILSMLTITGIDVSMAKG